MLREREKAVRQAIIILDAVVVSVMFFLTFYLRRDIHAFYKLNLIPSTRVVAEMAASINDYFVILFLIVPLWCFVLYLNGMYESFRTKSIREIIWIVVKSAVITTFAFGTAVFVFKLEFVSRAFFIMFMVLSSVVLLCEKLTMFAASRYIRKKGYNFRRLLVVGTGRRAIEFIRKITIHPEWGIKIVGAIDYERANVGRAVEGFEGLEVLGSLEDIPKILHRRNIDEVIFIVPRAQLGRIENYLYVCETEGIKTAVAVDLFELKISKLRQTEIEGVPLITFETTPITEWQLLIKRAFDVIVSGIGIVLLSPVFLITAILIKLTSKGPLFFIQKRVGLNGRNFVLYKFRSMHKGAHLKLSEVAAMNEAAGPVFKIKNDPRITAVGKVLRKFSIDELPQLFNVFFGQMSIVGPRPPIPREVRQYKPWQRRRLSMRPGITCLWQISGRSKVGFNEWMRMDLEYIDNWSLSLDFKILVKTMPVVIFGVGAY